MKQRQMERAEWLARDGAVAGWRHWRDRSHREGPSVGRASQCNLFNIRILMIVHSLYHGLMKSFQDP